MAQRVGYHRIRDAKLRFISESSAIIFKVFAGSNEYVLRVNPESVSDAWIARTKGELLWLMALQRDTELVLPKPILAADGSIVQKVTTRKILLWIQRYPKSFRTIFPRACDPGLMTLGRESCTISLSMS